jgi:hypothetical protein
MDDDSILAESKCQFSMSLSFCIWHAMPYHIGLDPNRLLQAWRGEGSLPKQGGHDEGTREDLGTAQCIAG